MKAWLLFLLGAIAYFFIRYANRTNKVKDFNIGFWWKDNMPELIASLAINLAVMMILMDADTNITELLKKYLPDGLVVSAKLVSALACGLGLGAGVYELFKKKVKDTKV